MGFPNIFVYSSTSMHLLFFYKISSPSYLEELSLDVKEPLCRRRRREEEKRSQTQVQVSPHLGEIPHDFFPFFPFLSFFGRTACARTHTAMITIPFFRLTCVSVCVFFHRPFRELALEKRKKKNFSSSHRFKVGGKDGTLIFRQGFFNKVFQSSDGTAEIITVVFFSSSPLEILTPFSLLL